MSIGAPRVNPLTFGDVSALTARSPNRFDAEVNPEWTIAGKPNGGHLLAILGRAAASVSAHVHVIAASAHYLHAPQPGPVVIEAELLRGGRSTSHVRARMSQDGKACVEALLTTSQLDDGGDQVRGVSGAQAPPRRVLDRGVSGAQAPAFDPPVHPPLWPRGG